MRLYHATIEEREQGLDVKCIEFITKVVKTPMIEFIENEYHGKNKKVIFIAMIGSDTNDYFITDSYLKVQKYFLQNMPDKKYFLFEEPTYEEAFGYCKDHAEIHELGLNH